MRKLFAAWLARICFLRRTSHVLGKYSNNRSTKYRLFIEKARGSMFDLFSQSEKLLHTCAAFCSLRSREFIERGMGSTPHRLTPAVQGCLSRPVRSTA
jgi:hypothetical protein